MEVMLIGGFVFFTVILFVAGMFLFPQLFGISQKETNDSSDEKSEPELRK